MTNYKSKAYFYFSSVITFLLFIPIFNRSNIGSDWDSYAIIGTYKNYLENGIYIPSRPPGFPLYEVTIGILISFSDYLYLSSEQILLTFQFILCISFNLLIFKYFEKTKNSNFFIYLVIVLSPIYIISGLSVIDYFLGSFLGFLSLYLAMFKKDQKNIEIIISLFLALSVATRLSNLIFVLIIFLFTFYNQQDRKSAILIGSLSLILSLIIYLPFYMNLFEFYKSTGVYENWSDMLCIFNLTNTDHTIIGRMGRFILKQIPFFGTLGVFLFLFNIPKYNIDLKERNWYLFLLFIFFELSFLRLPTEEGHLLPSFIAFMILINKSKNKIFSLIFVLVFISNFVDLKFYSVDEIDSASSISFGLNIKSGFFTEDFNLRNSIGEDKIYHYNNAQTTLYNAWSNGCPN